MPLNFRNILSTLLVLSIVFPFQAFSANSRISAADRNKVIGKSFIPGSMSLSNVRNLLEAELYTEELSSRLKAELELSPGAVGSKNHPLQVIHVGNKVPSTLEYSLKKLKMNGIHISFFQIKEEELFKSSVKTLEKIDTTRFSSPSYLESTKQVLSSSNPLKHFIGHTKVQIKSLFGVPNGVSLWFNVPRDEATVRSDRRLGATAGLFAAASVAVAISIKDLPGYQFQDVLAYANDGSLLLKESLAQGLDNLLMMAPTAIRMAVTSTALGYWVYINVFYFRQIHEVMNQGRTLVMEQYGKIHLKYSNLFIYPANFIRAIMSNIVIVGAATSAMALYNSSLDPFKTIDYLLVLENAAIGIFARSQIDKWIASKTPTGHETKEIKWLPKTAGRVNFWWNQFFGLSKNLHLIGAGFIGDLLYYSLFAVNSVMLVKDLADKKIKESHLGRKLSCKISFK